MTAKKATKKPAKRLAPKTRESRRVVLVRPRGAGPSWWLSLRPKVERNALPGCRGVKGHYRIYLWCTVTEGGGFTNGFDVKHSVVGDEDVDDRIKDWFEAHDGDMWPWEIRAIEID